MKETDLAWAAGIIDGEGCIYISKAHQLYLRVTMTHYPTITRLYSLFGVGNLHTEIKPLSNCRIVYGWNCAAKDTGTVLLLIRPYLFTKLDQAEIALDYIFMPRADKAERHTKREHLYSLMKICKEKEWDWSASE